MTGFVEECVWVVGDTVMLASRFRSLRIPTSFTARCTLCGRTVRTATPEVSVPGGECPAATVAAVLGS